jgi:phosphoserine phosphatase RsbU/P
MIDRLDDRPHPTPDSPRVIPSPPAKLRGFGSQFNDRVRLGWSYLHEGWFRLTSGMEMEELWAQFKTEATESSRLYKQEVIQHAGWTEKSWKRPFQVFSRLSWSVLKKLSPARRVFLLLNLVLAILAIFDLSFLIFTRTLEFTLAFLGILTILVLVLADHISMKRDIEIAREIQRWLLPRRAPEVPGIDVAFTTRPAQSIGGDYYDAFQRSGDGPLLIAVADVAGKSVPAAMLMATFQASLRALATSRHSLSELIDRLNRQMYSNSNRGRFTTAFIAELDPATGVLHYLCAGHNPPILRRADGTIERLNSDNIPLGIELAEVYQVGVSHLDFGDVLVIYTDGVTEARNYDRQQFGEDRLVSILESSPEQQAAMTLTDILCNLANFVAASPQHDDITCMVVRRT